MLVMKVGVIAEKITQPANSGFVFCPQYRHLHIPYESNPPQKKKKEQKKPHTTKNSNNSKKQRQNKQKLWYMINGKILQPS